MGLKFCNLHSHSNASLGDAINLPEEHFNFVIQNAGEDSMAMALTNHGNCNDDLYAFQARNRLRKKGVPFKYIWGCELYYHPDLDEWAKFKEQKEEQEENDLVVEVEQESKNKFYDPLKRRHHLVCIVKNKIGLKNLYRIISDSYRRGFYRFPRTDFKTLEKYKEGLIISHACVAGLGSWIILRDHEKGEKVVFDSLDREYKPLLDLFGKENAYLEWQFNKMPEQQLINRYFEKYTKLSGYNIIATADSHFARPELWREREIYRLLSQQSKGYDVSIADLPEKIDNLKCLLYPKNGDQMFQSYQEYQPDLNEVMVKEAIERTYKIAHEQIEDIEYDTNFKLPKSYWKDKDEYEELSNLCFDGLEQKGLANNKEYLERLDRELKLINKKNLCLYFLTLKKAIDAVKKELLINCGRGSSCGSLVNYCLGITLIDPIKHALPFERFISETRNDAADIDTDVEDRDSCLEILRKEFGEENVIAISNFNSLQLKSLVKDVSKLYGIPYEEVNRVTTVAEKEARQPILDSIGNDQKLYSFDLDGAMKYSPTFKSFMEKYPQVSESIKVLFRQGKSIGRHAGGLLLTENADEDMPIIKIRNVMQTPWGEGITTKGLETVGFIKYDFLSLATLRTLRRAIERVLKKQNKEINIENVTKFYNDNLHPDTIGEGDIEVFKKIYHEGNFCGTFQFTMPNVQQFCVAAKPTTVSDISAITALWRPGALANDGDKKYLEAKDDPENIHWDHPILKEILGETYGVLIYQEQFLYLANKLAGFSLTESDDLRKLLMKPLTSLADEIKEKRKIAGDKFIQGCIDKGLSEKKANSLWFDDIMSYVSYGFSKNHSCPYAYLSYQCAHMLYHHPDEWVASYCECDPDTNNALEEVKKFGYTIAPVDILNSTSEWTVNAATRMLYPPLSAIKGLGGVATAEIVSRRSWWRETLSLREVAPTEKEIWDLFFFDQELVQLKKSSKIKKKWHFSKFNKRNLEMLAKTESLSGLNLIGEDKIFKNHAHFWKCLEENWGRRESIDIEEAATATNSEDWSNSEKIEFQSEILGTVPFDLILAPEELDILARSCHDIETLDEAEGVPRRYWFVLSGLEKKTTKNNRTYWKFQISNMKQKILNFNFWGKEPEEKFVKYGVYVGELYFDGMYINTKKFSGIGRIK